MPSPRPVPRWSVHAVTLGRAALILFLVLLLGLHLLRPDLTPGQHMVSEYALGRYGLLMGLAFALLSFVAAALLLALVPVRPPNWLATIGLLALAVLAAGTLVAALFPMDPPGGPYTPRGDIHVLDAQVNFVSAFLAALLLALSYRADPRWRPFFPTAMGAALGILLGFGLLIGSFSLGAWYGLANRVLAGAILWWLWATLQRIRALHAQTVPNDA